MIEDVIEMFLVALPILIAAIIVSVLFYRATLALGVQLSRCLERAFISIM